MMMGLQELYEAMNREISCTAATVLALAATKNEVLKETFMDLGADEALVRYLKNHAEEMVSDGAALQAACDAIRSLIVADDDRPAASKVILFLHFSVSMHHFSVLFVCSRCGIYVTSQTSRSKDFM